MTFRAVPFARDLAVHGDRVAIHGADGTVSYRELAARVARFATRLGDDGRRLVLLAGANTVDAVVAYLAALSAGHVVLLAPGDHPATVEALTAAYDPDVVVRAVDGSWRVEPRRPGSAHVLHPDLALLLSTSGSTGSPKLVRLSAENLQANAASIAEYLDIRPTDRAATTLPMHYCYGLSVVNSHLLRGAGLILTGLSVADTCFWDLFRAARGTSFAGVPFTFDLLDRTGFADLDLPHLRYVTQAGGRLAPDRVRRYAELGRRKGFDLFVMYGQTEATARMAYLPPDLAASRPQAVGVPVPGGAFRLEPLGGPADEGELVYSGPNVMLGYAQGPSDLRLGRTVDELRTGDVARRAADGLFEIVGRQSRFVKLFGLRIDLDRVEAMLERHGVSACCVDADDDLVVAGPVGDTARVRRLVAAECGLPPRAVRVHALAELPRLPTGKPDLQAVRTLVGTSAGTRGAPAVPRQRSPTPPEVHTLCALFATVLDRSDVTGESSFVSLGGDSLSYVEMSLRLEEALGHLPGGWHVMRIRDLRRAARPRVTRCRWVDTGVALRAVGIVFIVGSHIDVFDLPGGAHVLLGVAGYNVARFHLTGALRGERVRHLAASVARLAAACMVWIAIAHVLTDDYSLVNVFLLNEALGPHQGTAVYFWFVETLVYTLVGVTVFVALPVVDRIERRFPFGLPMALVAVALIARYDLLGVEPTGRIPTPVAFFWVFAIGWAAGKATTVWQRLAVTATVVVTLPGFFDKPIREAVVIGGLCLLVWVPRLPSLHALNRAAGVLATSSLFVYLTHWQVYPHVDGYSRVLALVASLAAGIAYALVFARLTAVATTAWRRLGRPGGPGGKEDRFERIQPPEGVSAGGVGRRGSAPGG